MQGTGACGCAKLTSSRKEEVHPSCYESFASVACHLWDSTASVYMNECISPPCWHPTFPHRHKCDCNCSNTNLNFAGKTLFESASKLPLLEYQFRSVDLTDTPKVLSARKKHIYVYDSTCAFYHRILRRDAEYQRCDLIRSRFKSRARAGVHDADNKTPI